MARRKPSGWKYSGVVQKRKSGTSSRRGSNRGWRRFFNLGRAKKRREPRTVVLKSTMPRARPRRSAGRAKRSTSGGLASWVFDKIANRKWRPVPLSEVLIWVAVGAVSLAFLMLMAKGTLIVAAFIFILIVAFIWRELGE